MFKKKLQSHLENIFGIKKVSFNEPGDTFEKDTLFVQVVKSTSRVTEGYVYAKVEGVLIVFSQLEKYPYGFMNKKIQSANREETKDLFFYDIDVENLGSEARLMNLCERRTGFLFLFKDQYDPNQGSLTSLEI